MSNVWEAWKCMAVSKIDCHRNMEKICEACKCRFAVSKIPGYQAEIPPPATIGDILALSPPPIRKERHWSWSWCESLLILQPFFFSLVFLRWMANFSFQVYIVRHFTFKILKGFFYKRHVPVEIFSWWNTSDCPWCPGSSSWPTWTARVWSEKTQSAKSFFWKPCGITFCQVWSQTQFSAFKVVNGPGPYEP